MSSNQKLDLKAIRARLAEARGKAYWQTLESLADTPEFKEILLQDFSRQVAAAGQVSRRQFLKLMAASLAMAGLASCGLPAAKIVPYVKQPAGIVPGQPLFFATAVLLGGYATGVLVESHEGRPTKIEGNPDHPASLGKTDAYTQAAILTLYDPDRAQSVMQSEHSASWQDFTKALQVALAAQPSGAGLRIVTETITSPTLASQLKAVLVQYPAAQWYQYEPLARDNVYAGAQLAFGTMVETQYRFDQAQVILALDADFLRSAAGGVRYAHDFSAGRRVRSDQTQMNRLYTIESTMTITGAAADHRYPQRASQIEAVARMLAQHLGIAINGQTNAGLPTHSVPDAWLAALVRDLQQHHGSSLIVVGDQQPPIVHALAHAINAALGNVNHTVLYTDPVAVNPGNQAQSLRQLVQDMNAGKVDAVIFLGGNPAYTAPADLNFADSLSKVKFRVHLGLYYDETSALCDWHIPETHPFEAWSDARAYDGSLSIIQPLIAPLYAGSISPHELLAALLGHPDQTSHDIVRSYWQGLRLATDFETAWRKALHNGVISQSELPAKAVTVKAGFDTLSAVPTQPTGLEIIFQPDPTLWDGRFANNGWLQELPKPLTQLTWDNAALISQATADRLGLHSEDLVELRYQGRTIQSPILIMPGQPDESVTVSLGYGRTRAGHVGTGTGFDAYQLRTLAAPWFDSGLQISPTGQTYKLASVHDHYSLEGRDIIHAASLQEFIQHPDFVNVNQPAITPTPASSGSLFPNHVYQGQQWGMSIDLSACIGCNACIIGCQSENNIPVVGKDEVLREREMHWLRVDRYYTGDLSNPSTDFQPVPCMHCEDAPCEVVCPVGATVHSDDGLNEMVYNRCIGTRYCSNNCPYKVRRFNFFQYSNYEDSSLSLLNNPEVTVRSQGVMEKCTYCIQRVEAAKIQAEKEGRPVRDGEFKTACQQACPTEAIIFGNINDTKSKVAQLKAQPHNYALLGELNTRPRTTYLGKVRNPNPEIEAQT